MQGQQRPGRNEPGAERRGDCRRGSRGGENQIAKQREIEGRPPAHAVGQDPRAESDHLEIAEKALRVGRGLQNQRGEVRATERPDREALDLVVQREHRDRDGRGGQQEDARAAVHEDVRPGRGPQAERGEAAARPNHRGAVGAHPSPVPLVPPGGNPDARYDGPDRTRYRRYPPAIERVLEKQRRRDEQRGHANREQPALAKPLFEIGLLRRWCRRDGRRWWRRRHGANGGDSGGGERQTPPHGFEGRDPALAPLDGFLLLVGHTGAGDLRDPATVIAAVTATMMTRSGIQPNSVIGTVICRKSITKSNRPITSPRSTVYCKVRPRCRSTLPVTRATAPWPAAIATATTVPLNRVSMTADRPGW